MMELQVKVWCETETGEQSLLAHCLTGLAELRAKGRDKEALKCTLEMKPKGQMWLEVTFHPRETKLVRKKAMYEKFHLHHGHRYVLSSFSVVIKCAHCQVTSCTFPAMTVCTQDLMYGVFEKGGLECQNCGKR